MFGVVKNISEREKLNSLYINVYFVCVTLYYREPHIVIVCVKYK